MQILGFDVNGYISVIIDDVAMTVPDDMANRHRQEIYDWEFAPAVFDALTGEQVGQRERVNTIPPYVAPPAPVPATITNRQFFQQLAIMGLITQAEALAAVRVGELPAAFQTMISSLPSDQQFDAEMKLSVTSFERSNELVAVFAAMQNMSSAQIDDIWKNGALL